MEEERDGAGHASFDFRVRRSALRQSVEASEGFSVYEAIVDQIDWAFSDPWLDLLRHLNASQRVVVSLAQVHEHAAFNGLEESLAFHGQDVVRMAADSAVVLGHPEIREMLMAALQGSRGWPELEAEWAATAGFEIAGFIEANAADFFVDE